MSENKDLENIKFNLIALDLKNSQIVNEVILKDIENCAERMAAKVAAKDEEIAKLKENHAKAIIGLAIANQSRQRLHEELAALKEKIVYCGECINYHSGSLACYYFGIGTKSVDYCSRGVRRTK